MTSSQHLHTKQDILQQLLKRGQATAQELAETLAISPQAVRRHLKELEAEGLIEYHSVQAGMGRPQHAYQLSHQGRAQFPDSYDDFAVSLLDTLAETVEPDQFGIILRKQWERKANEYRQHLGNGPLEERVAKLVEIRRAEGYMAEWYPVEAEESEGETGQRYIFTEYNCAISSIAESFPKVCDHELELFSMALQDCQVERTHWIIGGEHRCGYLIQSQKPAQTGEPLGKSDR